MLLLLWNDKIISWSDHYAKSATVGISDRDCYFLPLWRNKKSFLMASPWSIFSTPSGNSLAMAAPTASAVVVRPSDRMASVISWWACDAAGAVGLSLLV